MGSELASRNPFALHALCRSLPVPWEGRAAKEPAGGWQDCGGSIRRGVTASRGTKSLKAMGWVVWCSIGTLWEFSESSFIASVEK